ncbi:MAG: di-trans,poly-cis-decaprenylcistransferase [Firmicutes bacterium]|nr:di-trans,poly-cis-decaprenylcistransferase [Bacillota bacterium]
MNTEKLPRHIAIILDGNGRYAKKYGLLRQQGHKAGADNVEKVGDLLIERGIPYLTVYAFSTENWKRSEEEVSYLMALLKRYLTKNKVDALRKGIRIRVIGDRQRLSPELRELIREMEEDTREMKNLNLTVALNYGGRDELIRAYRRMSEERIPPEKIDEALISSYLDTADIPDPDLVIRTSGEERISNFLLWQIAYSELYFTDCYWPEFDEKELEKALESYSSRQRRFGGREEE